jgi:mono/diheme cytochrome c family protein
MNNQAKPHTFLPYLILVVLAVAILLILTSIQIPAYAQSGDDPPSDPLVLGAWLYEGNCVRCHGAYKRQRIAKNLQDVELLDLIEGGNTDGCEIDWGRSNGGPFSLREMKAVVLYMVTWEQLGREPPLPQLPPQPTPTPTLQSTLLQQDLVEETPAPVSTPELDLELKIVIEGSRLAWGAWLYTQNCHRCHLDYSKGRMGYGLSAEKIQKTIENGKVGTSMVAFGKRQGGALSYKEIKAILGYLLAYEQLGEPPALPEVIFQPPTPDPNALKMIPLSQVTPGIGNPERGALIFGVHCSNCHGPEGKGRIGASLRKDWLLVRKDLMIRSIIQNGSPGILMPAWSQSNGGSLSDQDISDLVALILNWDASYHP